jgi:hypothetical protein
MRGSSKPLAVVFLLLWHTQAAISRPSTKESVWRQDSAAAFGRGKKEGVVISEAGVVRLARAVKKTGALDVERVWALAIGPKKEVYAATGDKGQVWRRTAGGSWDLVYQGKDSQVLCLAVAPGGQLFAGTGPGGLVVEIDPASGASSVSKLSDDVKYVWELGFALDGSLYAATGPTGKLWKRGPGAEAEWRVAFDSSQPHLLSLAVASSGEVFAGSDGAGLIYKLDAAGKASVILDAPQDEIRVLRIGPDQALYAGTATPGATPAGAGRATTRLENSPPQPLGTSGGSGDFARRISLANTVVDEQDDTGSARLKAGAAGENVVYRIDLEGTAREQFRVKAQIFALAWQGDQLLVGTGPEGQIYEVRSTVECTPLVRLDHGQVMALQGDLTQANSIWIGVGDPGGVYKLEGGPIESGILTSDVFDTKLVSRFGTIAWQGETPGGSSIVARVRTGNVDEPDDTWSDWSKPQPSGERVEIPVGRFVQYQAVLMRGPGAESTPELKSISLVYRTRNLAPEISSITVPDLTAGDGTARGPKLEIKWDATDPNDDELEFQLAVKKEDWPDWLVISGESPLTDKQFAWDTSTVPSGRFRLRVTADDARSNPPDEVLQRSRESDAFLVDHEAPNIVLERTKDGIRCQFSDAFTRLVKAEHSIDGGRWRAAFPDDGLFDSTKETITIGIAALGAGTHVLVVRTTDAAGNTGAADMVFQTP